MSSSFFSLLGFDLGQFLLGEFGSASLVHLLFGIQTGFLLAANLFFDVLGDIGQLGFLFLHPVLELDFGLLLSHSAFLHTTHQVILQHHAGLAKQRAGGVGGLGANAVPIQSPVKLDVDLGGVGERVVGTYFLNELTITWRTRVGNYDVIEGLTLLAMSLQSNFCRHNLMF